MSVCLLKPIGKLMFIQCEASMSSFYNRNLTQGCIFYKLVVLFYMVHVFFVVCVHESVFLFFFLSAMRTSLLFVYIINKYSKSVSEILNIVISFFFFFIPPFKRCWLFSFKRTFRCTWMVDERLFFLTRVVLRESR